LLQSHRTVPPGERVLHLLPALPSAWPTGSVTGLRARGGFEVALVWAEGRLVEARIKSSLGNRCRVETGGLTVEFDTQAGSEYWLNDELALLR
jgi:alpha-L-fucosidase 2